MRLRRSSLLRGFACLALTAATVGCTSDADDEVDAQGAGASAEGECAVPEGERRELVAGGLISGSYGPVYVADGLGYYDDAGIEVEFTTLANPADALGLLAGGRLDVYLGAGSAGMLNQINSGIDVRIAGAGGNIATDEQYDAPSGFYVRKELFESGEVTEAADLEGRKVGSFGPSGSAVSYYIGLLLESGGLTLEEVEIVPLAPPSAMQALEQGAIAASYLTAPFSSQAVESGAAVSLGVAKEIYGDEQAPVIMLGKSLLTDDRATGCAFLAATMRGAEALQGEYWENPEVAAAFAEKMAVEPSFIAENAIYNFDPELTNDPRTIEGMQRMFGDLGLLQYDEPLSEDRVFAEDLRQQAAEAAAVAQ